VLVVAGAICAALVDGLTGEVLAIALITLGLGAVVLLIFLEVGLSESGNWRAKRSGEASALPIESGNFGIAADRAGPAEFGSPPRAGQRLVSSSSWSSSCATSSISL
jgi:uncharacterized membrane protein